MQKYVARLYFKQKYLVQFLAKCIEYFFAEKLYFIQNCLDIFYVVHRSVEPNFMKKCLALFFQEMFSRILCRSY